MAKCLTNVTNADIIPPRIFFTCPFELYIKILKHVSFKLIFYQFKICKITRIIISLF